MPQNRVFAGQGISGFTPLETSENIGIMGSDGAPMIGGPFRMRFTVTGFTDTAPDQQSIVQFWTDDLETERSAFTVENSNSGTHFQCQVEIGSYSLAFSVPPPTGILDVYELLYDGDLWTVTWNGVQVGTGNTGPQPMIPMHHCFLDSLDESAGQNFRVQSMFAGNP